MGHPTIDVRTLALSDVHLGSGHDGRLELLRRTHPRVETVAAASVALPARVAA